MNSVLRSGLTRAAFVAYGLAAALSAFVLWGWALGIPSLRDLGAHFPPMPPAAAIGMVLLAGAFLGAERGERRGPWLAAGLAALIAALSLAGVPLDLGLRGVEAMSPAAAVSMLLLALATPLGGQRKLFGRIPPVSASAFIAGVV